MSEHPDSKSPPTPNNLEDPLNPTQIVEVDKSSRVKNERFHALTAKALANQISLPVQFAVKEISPTSFVVIGVRPSLESSDQKLIVDAEEVILAEGDSA